MKVKRCLWVRVLGAAAWAASSLASAADSFTVGVLSCAAETDRDRRLDCYDRAVATFTTGLSRGKGDPAAASAPATRQAPAATTVSAATAVPPPAAAPVATAPVASPAAPSIPVATAGKAGPPEARHFAARITRIDHFPDYVVVHLDNEQVWKQVSDSPGGPVLRTGDPVTIDKQMGSYWLAASRGEAVQVKLETPKP